MTDNRRNHYRVLHVQPDAPAEVIKASWRTLMLALRQHPDLGGSHEQAVMVNQAWAVLGDAAQRAAYDDSLRHQAGLPHPGDPTVEAGQFVTRGPAGAAARAGAVARGVAAPALVASEYPCAFCRQASAGLIRADSRCGHCHSPLARLPDPARGGHELLGRRAAVRRDQNHVAVVHLGWPSQPLAVRWRDLSLTGLSFYAAQKVEAGARLRLIDSAIEGVVEVVGCRAQGRVHTLHARWLTGMLLQSTGVFVSAQA